MSDYTKSKNRRMILSSMAAVVFCAAIGLNACTMPAKSDQETPAQVQEAKDPAGEQAEPTDAHHDSLDTHDDYTSMQEGDPHDSQENKNEQDGAENRILPLVKPDRFYYYNGHTYGIYEANDLDLYSFSRCQLFCTEQGGYLAAIGDAEENAFLYDMISKDYKVTAFFGYTGEEEEGVWKWDYFHSGEYENWTRSGDWDLPDNGEEWGGDEDYAEFNYDPEKDWVPNDGTWNDAPFMENTRLFICEWDYEVDESEIPDNTWDNTVFVWRNITICSNPPREEGRYLVMDLERHDITKAGENNDYHAALDPFLINDQIVISSDCVKTESVNYDRKNIGDYCYTDAESLYYFDTEMLEFAGINKIETIGAFAQIWFRTDVEYFRNPVLTRLVNNGSGSDAGEVNHSDRVLYNENGVKVSCLGSYTNDGVCTAVYLASNDTGENVRVRMESDIQSIAGNTETNSDSDPKGNHVVVPPGRKGLFCLKVADRPANEQTPTGPVEGMITIDFDGSGDSYEVPVHLEL